MFEWFSSQAREAMLRAQQQAQAVGHDYVGTEHVLLALLDEPDGGDGASPGVGPAAVLRAAGVHRDTARARAGELTSVEPVLAGNTPVDVAPFGTHMPFTMQTRQVCSDAFRFTSQYAHPAVEPGHLLLALAGQQSPSNALRLLGPALAVAVHDLRARAEHALTGHPSEALAAGPGPEHPSADPAATGGLVPSPRYSQILIAARQAAHDRGHPYLGVEHLMLAILDDGASLGAAAIAATGTSLETVRAELAAIMSRADPHQPDPPTSA